MMKRIVQLTATVLVVALIWAVAQALVVPKYVGDCTSIVDGYYALEENSVDVLFLGASQMYCTVDAQRLTEEYDISAYDFGCSSQNLVISYYYLQEALKTQKPDVVMVEVCQIFSPNENLYEDAMAWSYAPTKLSLEKVRSLYRVTNGDLWKTVSYTFPLLQFHSRWNSVWVEDLTYYLQDKTYPPRGFLQRDRVMPAEIAYLSQEDGPERPIPEDAAKAVEDIAALCQEKGISLVLFKSPVTTWTRTDSSVVKTFMDERKLEFLDLNDYLDRIDIDGQTDFFDESHLNTQGAEKTTDFIAAWLIEKSNN